MKDKDTIVVSAKREYLKGIRYAHIVIKAWIGVRLMKSVAQMLYEYKGHDTRKLLKLWKDKRYRDIELDLGLPSGTIKLYKREYDKFIKEVK